MRLTWRDCRVGLLLAGLLVPAVAAAQDGRVVVFRDFGFAGPQMTFTRANPDLGRAMTVRSARVDSGKWELCERTRFRGSCVTLTQAAPSLARPEGWRGSMLSIRPLPMPMPEPEPADDVRRRPDAPGVPARPGRPGAAPEALKPVEKGSPGQTDPEPKPE